MEENAERLLLRSRSLLIRATWMVTLASGLNGVCLAMMLMEGITPRGWAVAAVSGCVLAYAWLRLRQGWSGHRKSQMAVAEMRSLLPDRQENR